jgi:peptidoglycan/LPS O-acetylase OafA/YrhL
VDWSPSLAGLRGLAILLVVVFHLGLPVPAGGPVGVTVFFVLSGFLITSLLASEIRYTGHVDLCAFFERRVRRLLPALVVAVLVILSVSAMVGGWSDAFEDSLLVMTYTANWARAGGDGMGMWNHAWSLAIEGQFYVVWPVAMLLIARYTSLTSRRTIVVLALLATTSALLRVALAAAGAPDERSYFGTDTRGEALVVGAAVACVVARRADLAVPTWAGAMGLVAVIVAALLPDSGLGWSGSIYSVVAISTAVLILAVRTSGQGFGLASRPMTWLGERSYSLYLWHVPVILVVRPLEGLSQVGGIAAALVAMLVLTEISYRYVERPFRRRKDRAVSTTVGRSRPEVPRPLPVPEGI